MNRSLLRWWTVKDAIIKADGRGLSIDPKTLCCAALRADAGVSIEEQVPIYSNESTCVPCSVLSKSYCTVIGWLAANSGPISSMFWVSNGQGPIVAISWSKFILHISGWKVAILSNHHNADRP